MMFFYNRIFGNMIVFFFEICTFSVMRTYPSREIFGRTMHASIPFYRRTRKKREGIKSSLSKIHTLFSVCGVRSFGLRCRTMRMPDTPQAMRRTGIMGYSRKLPRDIAVLVTTISMA